MLRRALVLLLLAPAACINTPTTPANGSEELAPYYSASPAFESDRYLVRFKDGIGDPVAHAARLVTPHGGQIRYVYRHTIAGVYATLPSSAINSIRSDAAVRFIAQDQPVAQPDYSWALDRIDQRTRPLPSAAYTTYFNGSGVRIYVLGSGVRGDHADFGGRVVAAWTADSGYPADEDCTGHETAAASAAAGSSYGSAPAAAIYSVRFTECGATWPGDMISAVDWVAGNFQAPAIANMSWHIPDWVDDPWPGSLEQAVEDAIADGIQFVVSAGGSGAACNNSPGRASIAVTVAGLAVASDTKSSGSSWGTCVDFFAPGEVVPVAWHTSSTADTALSGTSFAAPLAAGVGAQILQQDIYATPALIHQILVQSATPNVMTGDIGSGSPNLVLYSVHPYGYIDGPALIVTPGQKSWTAKRWGGTGTYGYLWEYSENGSDYSTVGTSITYTETFDSGVCYPFWLRLTLNFGTESQVFTKYIQVQNVPCPE